jgi:glycosyltransferase involved in cell wall biosynthesis
VARIGVDGLMISSRGKGHARTQRHAVEALAERGEHEVVVFVREPIELPGVDVVHVPDRLTLGWELRGMSSAARRFRLDAFLTFSERLPLRPSVPIIVWLFESPLHRIQENRRTHAPLRHRASDAVTTLLWRRSLKTAAHVAMGSRATEAEVVATIPELRGRTSVVYPGIAPGFGPGAGHRGVSGAYVLHLGSNDPRDNTAAAVDACRRAGVTLRVAGGWTGSGAEALGRVSDEDLVDLYRGAAAFLDPSLYEGFGYGVLEAMACGAPVVASNTTSIPEVVGDAGLLVEPRDIAALAAAVRRILDEPELAADLRRRGLERASVFTWERAGEGLTAAFDRVGLRSSSAP